MLYLRAFPKYNLPRAYIRRGNLTEGFLRNEFEGLIHGGAYSWNFTVCLFESELAAPIVIFFHE